MGFFSGIWSGIKEFFGGQGSFDSGTGTRLYVGNLSYKVTEEELRSFFSKQGRVKTIHLIRDRFTRRFKGYAFIEMNPEDSRKALSLNGADFLGRKLVVSAAKTKNSGAPNTSVAGSPRRQGGQQRWRRRRSGPRAYGQQKDNSTPIQRYE